MPGDGGRRSLSLSAAGKFRSIGLENLVYAAQLMAVDNDENAFAQKDRDRGWLLG
jgi:hypothetical protein